MGVGDSFLSITYLRDRLIVARELVTESGSVFVQIGDHNVHLVRSVMDEVFGSDNFVSLIAFKKTTGQTSEFLAGTSDYVVWYAKDIERLKYRSLYKVRSLGEEGADAYTLLELDDGVRRRILETEFDAPDSLPAGSRAFRYQLIQSQRQGRASGPGTAMYFAVPFEGKEFFPEGNRGWSTTQGGVTL